MRSPQPSPSLVFLVTTSAALFWNEYIKLTCCKAFPSTHNHFRGKSNGIRQLEEEYLPTFESNWELMEEWEFPLDVGESQGTLIGTDLYSVGGFFRGYKSGPKEGYALDLSDPTATWREMAPNPIDPFLTHAAQAVVGDNKLYLCGGYLGAHPGRAIDDCHVFDKTDGPMGSWTQLPSLPAPRGGGGMVYIESHNALLFSLGADRPDGTAESTIDLDGTWILDLDDLTSGWQPRKIAPYKSNHVSTVVAKDCAGEIHYLFVGGQLGESENDSNLADMYEYFPDEDEWVERASMLEGRGHFTTATVPYGCGFLIVTGAVDGKNLDRYIKTNDISYYDASLDKWTSIGDFPRKQKTPICAVYDDWLYCTCGYEVDTYRVKLSFPLVPSPAPSLSRTGAPSAMVSGKPSALPSALPTELPSVSPSKMPSELPSALPSLSSTAPSAVTVSGAPSEVSSSVPSVLPSKLPSVLPSVSPHTESSTAPSVVVVSGAPSEESSNVPSALPSKLPSVLPSVSPHAASSTAPSAVVASGAHSSDTSSSDVPSALPSSMPMALPAISLLPLGEKQVVSGPVSDAPSVMPSVSPSSAPSVAPSVAVTAAPTAMPTEEEEEASVEVARLRINVRTDPFCDTGTIIVVPKDEFKNNLPGVNVTLDIAAPAGPLTLIKTSNAKGKARFTKIAVNDDVPGESQVTACVTKKDGALFCKKSFITVCG